MGRTFAVKALERATALVLEIMGGRAGAITETVLPEHLPQASPVPLRRDRLRRVLGLAVDDAEVERILRALGMQVTATAEGWSVQAPSRRFDIAIEEDLVEEIARIHGYERIPTTTPTGEVRLVAPSETRVADIILAVDEPIAATRCRPGSTKGCTGTGARCVTHDLWEELGRQIHVFLASVSLADVIEKRVLGRAQPCAASANENLEAA